jgi:hypothetical protein
MSRDAANRLTKSFGRTPKLIGGAHHVARLFLPAYDAGIAINITVRRTRNSDARRRLARMFETRRVVS